MTAFVFVSSSADITGHIARARGERTLPITLVVADGLGDRDVDGMTVIDIGTIDRSAFARLLDRSVVTRTLVRLSPADGGVVMRRRLRRSAAATRALREGDVLVACERDAVLAVWSAARGRGEQVLGLFGIAAGLAELRRH